MTALLILLASILPTDSVVVDRVDLIERHLLLRYLPESNKYETCFEQYIFWRLSESGGGTPPMYHAVEFRLTTKVEAWPEKTADGYRLEWLDAHHGNKPRRVIAPMFEVSASVFDPETSDREFVPQQRRKGFK